jgi:hypothetical protein
MYKQGKKSRDGRNKKYAEDYSRFKLKTQDELFAYKPEEVSFKFYQICMHSIDGKYHELRKLTYNQDLEVLYRGESKLKKSKIDKFVKNAPDHKYEIVSTYEISTVPLPSTAELLVVNSQILNANGNGIKGYEPSNIL